MVENTEDDNKYEDARKQIDTLDKSIDDLVNKNQEEVDFTQYERELQNIYNGLKNLDTTIGTIVNKDIKKDLQDRLEKLKAKILPIISDLINIDNFINGKTTDTSTNNQVIKVNNQFYRELEGLCKGLDFGNIDKLLSEPLTVKSFEETLQFLGIPERSFQISGQNYPGFVSPINREMYALVDGRLKMCELENYLKPNPGLSITTDIKPENPKASSNGEKKTVKVNKNLGNGFSVVGSMDINESPIPGPGGNSGTLWTGFEWKGWKKAIGSTSTNTNFSAYYSHGGFTGESAVIDNTTDYEARAKKYEENKGNGWKNKPTYKLVLGENVKVKFKNGDFNFSIKEILKTNDFSKLKLNNFYTEMKVAYKYFSTGIKLCGKEILNIWASLKFKF